MKKSKRIIATIAGVIASMTLSSCSVEKLAESLGCDSEGLFSKALVEKTFYQEALDAYAEDQSAENCQELRSSGNDYIKAVNTYLDCSKEGDEATQRELKDAEKALADLDC